MKQYIKPAWIHDVARANNIQDTASLNPNIVSKVVQDVETQVRRLLYEAKKFQKRSKKPFLTIDDLNLALDMNKHEQIYGLSATEETIKQLDSNKQSSLTTDTIPLGNPYTPNYILPLFILVK